MYKKGIVATILSKEEYIQNATGREVFEGFRYNVISL